MHSQFNSVHVIICAKAYPDMVCRNGPQDKDTSLESLGAYIHHPHLYIKSDKEEGGILRHIEQY